MSSEREDSMRKGIHPPDESPEAQRAAKEKRDDDAEAPAIGGGMGGTSDAGSPADESIYKAQHRGWERRMDERRGGERREDERREDQRREEERRQEAGIEAHKRDRGPGEMNHDD